LSEWNIERSQTSVRDEVPAQAWTAGSEYGTTIGVEVSAGLRDTLGSPAPFHRAAPPGRTPRLQPGRNSPANPATPQNVLLGG
jgi:hypothetical protein